MDIKRVGIVANSSKEKAAEYSLRLGRWLSDRGLEVFFEEEIAGKTDMPGVSRSDLASAVDFKIRRGLEDAGVRLIISCSNNDVLSIFRILDIRHRFVIVDAVHEAAQ